MIRLCMQIIFKKKKKNGRSFVINDVLKKRRTERVKRNVIRPLYTVTFGNLSKCLNYQELEAFFRHTFNLFAWSKVLVLAFWIILDRIRARHLNMLKSLSWFSRRYNFSAKFIFSNSFDIAAMQCFPISG